MKTCILGLCLLGITNLMHSQNDLALVTPKFDQSTSHTFKTPASPNSEYLSRMAVQPEAVKVKKLQTLVANYDIKAQSVYSKDKSITYTVVFESPDNYVKAIYDHEGNVVSCQESYTDVRMPYSISGQLAKDYPGWEFSKVEYIIEYTQYKATVLTYKVKLKKGNVSKSVKIIV